MELLVISKALYPQDSYNYFNVEDICKLASKFYPMDFTEQEKLRLKYQLEIYKLNVIRHPKFQKLTTSYVISEFCQ